MEDVINLLDSRKPGVTEKDIISAEKELDAVFPAEYKELFKKTNNAEVGEWTLFPIKDPKNIKRTWDDVVRQNKEARDEGMAGDLVTIGEDGTGDKLCYRIVDQAMEDQVYLWNHESGELEEMASSLKEFILSYSEVD
ncbi:SMI1/KNR4 family protein [Mesobacillus subterraneus]|uniref:SMI1/KNR4 family protein n=1 Tax=Mesobacillus subterraneus TaxID=285983 RepID=A0A3R9E8J2_9BACI|nr:SMI1/KNR4 family protein [Mesobacillus subterraneus]RSD28390.1 SMI1/KNR4 family protein [Mesobacillus subterraneus]